MFPPVESTAISGGSAEHPLTRPSDLSVAQVGEILPRLGITKRRFKQVESICLVREQRASGRQELAFNARPFRFVRSAPAPPTERSTDTLAAQRQIFPSNTRPPRLRSALRSRSAHPHLGCNARTETEKPDRPLSKRLRDARLLPPPTGWLPLPPNRRRIQTYLRLHHLLRNGRLSRRPQAHRLGPLPLLRSDETLVQH